MDHFNTAFVGAGNMAVSIIGGMRSAGFGADRIAASAKTGRHFDGLRALGIEQLSTDSEVIVRDADVVVLAVKPQVLREACTAIAPVLQRGQLVLSVAAGVSAASIASWIGTATSLVRCVPNTPSLVGLGASALYAHGEVPAAQRQRAEAILAAVGVVRWVEDESLLHAATALSGSGPAYFFLFMEAMIDEAQRMGLDADTARTLCAQTCLGAGHMLAHGDVDAAELRRRVTSPGGTTERAIALFRAAGLEDIVGRAMRGAAERSGELARELA